MTQSRFDQLINETGSLTSRGKEVFGKTLRKGLSAFLGELEVDGAQLSPQQVMIVKSIVMKEMSDNIPSKKNK